MTDSSPVAGLDRELDVGEHPVGVRVGDQQRPAFARCGRGEFVPVDEPNTGLDRIDAETRPGDVQERHRRADVALHILRGRREVARRCVRARAGAGHGVEDLAVLARGRASRSAISV